MNSRMRVSGVIGLVALLLSGPAMAVNVASQPTSDGGVTPYIIPGANPGGNRNCAEVGVAFFGNAAYYQCYSAKRNYPGEFGLGFQDISGNPGCAQTIVVGVTDDTYVDFDAFPQGIGAAIIKGGNDSNVYVYEPQALSDSGLAPPLAASGDPAELGNIGSFCWNPDDAPPGECFEDETAWSAGSRYTLRGNWASYTAYSGVADVVTLFAGQHHDAGDVQFSAPVGNVVTITILLNPGWRFALNVVGEDNGLPIFDNNVKVQDYASAPSGNPSPGLFAWKKFAEGDMTSIDVPLNNFYGVHVDVEREVPCPD